MTVACSTVHDACLCFPACAFTCHALCVSSGSRLYVCVPQDSYIQSRADTMQNIESTIVELGSIFQQLAHMVKEQEETITR